MAVNNYINIFVLHIHCLLNLKYICITEQPSPVSDQIFVLLIDKFGNNGSITQLGLQMGLSRPENDKIFNDALITNREHQLLRVIPVLINQ